MPSQRHENSYPLVLARSSHHNVTMPLQRLHQHPACGLGLRKTRTFLENGVSGHGLLRFVHLARQGVVKVTGFTDALDDTPASKRRPTREVRATPPMQSSVSACKPAG
jgi:hypothetical protein